MNATNLITDYIIAGVLGILCLLVPYCVIFDYDTVTEKCVTDLHNPTLLAVIFTAVAYAFGVIFNQIADKLEDWLNYCVNNRKVEQLEENLRNELGIGHHYALQYVVTKSNNGYDFLSFRRTMIRIFRACWCLFFLFPILHVGFSISLSLCWGYGMKFSMINAIICILSWLFAYLLTLGLGKLYTGYYAAMINFVKIIRSGEGSRE